MLVAPRRAHIDGAALAVGVLLHPDDFGGGGQRVAGIDGGQEAELGIAEIGDGVARNVRHGLADDDVEDEQVVDGAARIADRVREGVGGLHGEARAVKRGEQAHIAHRHGARRGVHDLLAELEVLEIVAGDGLVGLWALRAVHVVFIGSSGPTIVCAPSRDKRPRERQSAAALAAGALGNRSR